MSPSSLSAVLEKLILRLCLADFPCRCSSKVRWTEQLFLMCQMGHVRVFVQRWPAPLCTLRANDHSLKRQRGDGTGRGEAEETQALLDLLGCPHSLWHQVHSWSPHAASLRELALQAPQHLHANFVYAFFTSLRILEKDVSFFSLFFFGGGGGASSDLIRNQWFCDVEMTRNTNVDFHNQNLSSNPSCFKSEPVFPV